jgi:hypothetical protein
MQQYNYCQRISTIVVAKAKMMTVVIMEITTIWTSIVTLIIISHQSHIKIIANADISTNVNSVYNVAIDKIEISLWELKKE